MKNIYIIPNALKDKDYAVTAKTVHLLRTFGADVFLSIDALESGITGCKYTERPHDNTDLIIVIGGDGSFIDASLAAIDADVPILGINLGKVGYLSEVEPGDIAVLGRIFDGNYRIDEKMLLCAECDIDGVKSYSSRLAVNDIVISHTSYLGIADFTLCSNEGGLKWRADGVVISTPAGSTAYSLSAGGPIVSHDANAMIVTPIAPHSFFNRSIVFSENDEIKIKNTGNDMLNVSLDGRCFATLSPNDTCKVFASDKKLKVLTFKENNMFSTLFGKMKMLEEFI